MREKAEGAKAYIERKYAKLKNEEKEKKLNYTAVFELCIGIREFLDQDPNSVESITLRTMLSFSRIYRLEMLRKIGSPIAPQPFGGLQGKTLKDSSCQRE